MNPPREFKEVLASGDFVLFLGAGFSKDAGVPLWKEALQSLAEKMRGTDLARANLIEQDALKLRFLAAAETFYLAELTKAERAAALQSVFDPELRLSGRQIRLAGIACQAIITTNFDRVLPEAAVAAGAPLLQFTESDDDLDAARICNKRFLVRLHGRIESPETIVFAKRHYDDLPRRNAYIEFFREIFQHRNVIFFGFSFADPFITTAIRQMSDAANSVFRRKAFALMSTLPGPAEQELFDKAAIRAVVYDPSNSHSEAWAVLATQPVGLVPVPAEAEKVDVLRRMLATVYARARSRSFSAERVQVLAGLMLPVAVRQGVGVSVDFSVFAKEVRRELALPASIPDRDIKGAAVVLEADGIVRLGAAGIEIIALPSEDALQGPLGKLVDGLIARASLRYQYAMPGNAREGIREAIALALVIDGLHVAHSVIRRMPLDEHRVNETVDRAVRATRLPAEVDRGAFAKALTHLLTHPDAEEEKLLGSLSSVAFSTSLLIEDPVLALSREPVGSSGVFLDANVVLPWICKGHPLTELYGSIIEAFGGAHVFVLADYANELVSHRRLAIQAHKDGGFEDAKRLQLFVSLFEAHGINAFLAGFAGLQAAGFEGEFDAYLREHAPFETETEALRFLEGKGLVRSDLSDAERARVRGGPVLGALRAALRGRRSEIVVEHDAHQLEKLMLLHARGGRPYFITADKLLISCMAQTNAKTLLGHVLLPYQASYLAQLAGAKVRPGLARAMWMSSPDISDRVRDYYIDRVLREYEAALVKDLPEIVEATMTEMERIEKVFGKLDDIEDGDDKRVRIFTSLDRFEEGFYRKLLEAKRSLDLL